MLGAIAGDIIGSIYEARNIKTTDFPLLNPLCTYTDDTVLTLAVAEVILEGETGNPAAYVDRFHDWYDAYPDAGFGDTFQRWARQRLTSPYNSWGNGSAMRVSPIAYAFDTLAEVLAEAKVSAAVTHSHPEGIRGAQAVAAAIFLARNGSSKEEIRTWLDRHIQYDLTSTVEQIRPYYSFDVSCQGSVPQAIIAFMDSEDFEDAVRKAISLGGDSDTIACITGSIAEPFYGGVPERIAEFALANLDDRMCRVVEEFQSTFV
jgi:ADP-ribosylglycohydrolase